MSVPKGLSEREAALWGRVAATVSPLKGRGTNPPLSTGEGIDSRGNEADRLRVHAVLGTPSPNLPLKGERFGGSIRLPRPASPPDRHGLDSSWDRKLAKGAIAPDFTLDLHGASLDAAHTRLDHGLVQAKAMGARIVLLITGKPRGASSADRGQQRGAIRAKVLDWLAAGPHGGDIAAIRTAHRRHGGGGSLYLILRRRR